MSEIPTTSPIEWLVRVLALAFTLTFLGIEQRTHPPVVEPHPGDPAPYRAMTVIESAEAIAYSIVPTQVNLRVNGYQPDGCDFPVIVEQRREANTVYVEIYREIPANVRCPAATVPYEDIIRLDGEFMFENYRIVVNGYTVELNFGADTPAGIAKILHLVNSFEVGKYPSLAAYPSALYLTVHSTIDGCDFPTQHTQRREGNTVYVEIYREIPVSQACPAIAKFVDEEIPLEGGFEAGTYTFIVNGVEMVYEN